MKAGWKKPSWIARRHFGGEAAAAQFEGLGEAAQ